MTVIAPVIDTERLRLRPYEMGDLNDLFAYRTRPDVTRYVYWEPRDRDDVAAGLSRRARSRSLEREGDELILATELRETGRTIGDVSLQWISAAHRQAEIGFVFHPDYHGKGYASEAAREMLRLGFEGVGFHRIEGRCDARNDASARLMERLGMRREAHLVENEWFKGEWGSELVYAILDREWRAIAR
jgi:RimJ/RimL family protein N-acetyltransferase